MIIEVLILPSSITTFIGEDAEFRCIAPFNGISWFINDVNVITVQTIQASRRFTPRQDGKPGEESVLVITTTAFANNSAIKCSVQDESGTSVYSSEAQLRIQGIITRHSHLRSACIVNAKPCPQALDSSCLFQHVLKRG